MSTGNGTRHRVSRMQHSILRIGALVLAFGLMTFLSPETAEACDPLRYILTTSPFPSCGGSIEKQPPPEWDGKYPAGTVVTVTADAASGWQFDHWSDNVTDPQQSVTTVVVNDDMTVTATFVGPHDLTVSTVGAGYVLLAPPGGSYADGTVVSLDAHSVPLSGYVFNHWSGDLYGTTDPDVITMDADKSVTAHFVEPPPALTLTTDGQGAVTESGTQVLTDDFDDGDYDGWSVSWGAWSAANGYLETTNPSVGHKIWRNQTEDDIELWFSYSCEDTSQTWKRAYFYIRHVYPTDHYVRVMLYPEEILLVEDSGAGPFTLDQESIATDEGEWYDIYVYAQGPDIEVWRGPKGGDLTKVLDTSVCEVLTSSNSVIYVAQYSDYRFDDISVATLDVLTLTADAAEGWRFDHWEGDVTGDDNPATIDMDDDKSVHAVFVQVYPFYDSFDTQPLSPAWNWRTGLNFAFALGGYLEGYSSTPPPGAPSPGPQRLGFCAEDVNTEVSLWYSYRDHRSLQDLPADAHVARICLRRNESSGDYAAVRLSPDTIEIEESVAGGPPTTLASAAVTSYPSTWYNLRMRCKDNKLRVWRRDETGAWVAVAASDNVTMLSTEGFLFDLDEGSVYWLDEFRAAPFSGVIDQDVGAMDTVSLATSVSTGQGTITPSGGEYPENESIFIAAEPSSPTCAFHKWEGDDVDSAEDAWAAATRLKMDTGGPGGTSKSLAASVPALLAGCPCDDLVEVYVLNTGYLHNYLWVDDNKDRGAISTEPQGEPVTQGGWPGVKVTCHVGTQVRIRVEPKEHPTHGVPYRFVYWTGGGEANMCFDKDTVFTVTGPTTVSALLLVQHTRFECLKNFDAAEFGSITVTGGGNCFLTYTETTTPPPYESTTQAYEVWGPFGQSVNASATAAQGYRVAFWGGCDARRKAEATIPLYCCGEFNPVFSSDPEPETVNLTVSVEGHGLAFAQEDTALGPESYLSKGQTLKLQRGANAQIGAGQGFPIVAPTLVKGGWSFYQWLDGNGNPTVPDLENITEDRSYTAEFRKNIHLEVASKRWDGVEDGQAVGYVTGQGRYDYPQRPVPLGPHEVTLVPHACDGWEFDQWKVNGVETPEDEGTPPLGNPSHQLTLTMDEDKEVLALFKLLICIETGPLP